MIQLMISPRSISRYRGVLAVIITVNQSKSLKFQTLQILGQFTRSNSSSSESSHLIVPDRGYVKVTGKDMKKFLQGVSTNDMNLLSGPKSALATAFLSPKGRVVTDAIVYDTSDPSTSSPSCIIEVHDSQLQNLLAYLKSYKLRSSVTIEPAQLKTIIHIAKESRLPPTGLSIPHEDVISTVADPRASLFGNRSILRESVTLGLAESNDIMRKAYNAFRLIHGLPEGLETSGQIPLEVNLDLLNYISFKKGCYVGQELVARTKFKGLIRKRLVPFIFAENSMISSFQPLEDKQVLDSIANSSVGSQSHPYADCEIMGKESGKIFGKVVSVFQNMRCGFAMVRLEALYPSDQAESLQLCLTSESTKGEPTKQNAGSSESTEKNRVVIENIQVIRPTFWPDIDPHTGKKIDHVES